MTDPAHSAFQLYPCAAFCEILYHLIEDPRAATAASDLQLLQTTVEILQDVAGADNPATYCHKLSLATARCTALVQQRPDDASMSMAMSMSMPTTPGPEAFPFGLQGGYAARMLSPGDFEALLASGSGDGGLGFGGNGGYGADLALDLFGHEGLASGWMES
jgi:hypothetical protein